MESDKKLELCRELVKSCSVPELKHDLDTMPIQSEHFNEYRQSVEQNLPLLYDFVQQQETLLSSNELEWQKVHGQLIVLLCEITAQRFDTPYKASLTNLYEHGNKLLGRQKPTADVEKSIFSYYQTRLRKDTWKRHLGTVHSFYRFLEVYYNDDCDGNKLTSDWLNLTLSVGMCVRDCPDPIYKEMSTEIFLIMLEHGKFQDVRDMNIYSVVYDVVFKDIHQMDALKSTDATWRCLTRCLDFNENLDSFNWSIVDDMMEALFKSINLCNDGFITAILIKHITKLSCYFSIDHKDIWKACTDDWSIAARLKDCRAICSNNSSHTIFRWAKCVLEMLNAESYKLLLSTQMCHQLLLEMHRCYLVCILPIALPIIESHLVEFYKHFTQALMKTCATHISDDMVTKLVQQLIETFHQQLLFALECKSIGSLRIIRDAYEILLKHEIFVKNK